MTDTIERLNSLTPEYLEWGPAGDLKEPYASGKKFDYMVTRQEDQWQLDAWDIWNVSYEQFDSLDEVAARVNQMESGENAKA